MLGAPPPAYEITPTVNNHETIGVASANEAPPPYSLVDPSKVLTTDHLPRYSQITPLEMIDLSSNTNQRHEQVNHTSLDRLNVSLFRSLLISNVINQRLLLGLYQVRVWISGRIVPF